MVSGGAEPLYVNVIEDLEENRMGRVTCELIAVDWRDSEFAGVGYSVEVTPTVIVKNPEVSVEEVVSN